MSFLILSLFRSGLSCSFDSFFSPETAPEEEEKATQRVRDILDESVKTGRVGNLYVDPSFLKVNYLQGKEMPNFNGYFNQENKFIYFTKLYYLTRRMI